jgi:hypothetical protein
MEADWCRPYRVVMLSASSEENRDGSQSLNQYGCVLNNAATSRDPMGPGWM